MLEYYTVKRKKSHTISARRWVFVSLSGKLQKDYMGKAYYSSGGRRGMARRLSWNEPCLTLKATSPSQMQTERCHPDPKHVHLTVRRIWENSNISRYF